MTHLKWLLVGLFVGGLVPSMTVTYGQGGLAPFPMLQGTTDSVNALVITMVTATGSVSAASPLANLRGKVDSVNALVVTCPDLTCGGGGPFVDSTAIIKGSADATKLFAIEVDGFTTGTTRTFTPPNANLTITTAAGTVTDDTTVSAMVDTLGGASATGSGGLVRLAGPTFTGAPALAAATATSVTAGASVQIDGNQGIRLAAGYLFSWVPSSTLSATGDTAFERISAGIVGLYDPASTTQDTEFRVSALHTDGSNYHYGSVAMSDTALTISTQTLGTGVDNLNIGLTPSGTGGLLLSAKLWASPTAPTISAGGCTSPTISANGTVAYKVTIGTSCTAVTTFTLTFPAAAVGWACTATNQTVLSSFPRQTSHSTTTAVVTNLDEAGSALDWGDGNVIVGVCSPI